jgi:hypothetical protein
MSSPLFNQNLGLPKRIEDLAIDQLIPEFAVERFVLAILTRAAWFNEQRLGPETLHPAP